MPPDLIITDTLPVEINYGQVGFYTGSDPWEGGDARGIDAMTAANDEAWESRRFVGVADDVAVVVSPIQTNFNAPMMVEFWTGQPTSDDALWDHVVDIDLTIRGGTLFFVGSGGRPSIPYPKRVPVGNYRVRVSGRGYAQAGLGIEGFDTYRLWAWPRRSTKAPELRQIWPGWAVKVPAPRG